MTASGTREGTGLTLKTRLKQSDVEIERRRRITVSAWAYAYEVENDPLVDDALYDAEARLVRPELSTGHDVLDQFFRTEFSPHTGMWVLNHPEKHKLAHMCAVRRARSVLSTEGRE